MFEIMLVYVVFLYNGYCSWCTNIVTTVDAESELEPVKRVFTLFGKKKFYMRYDLY